MKIHHRQIFFTLTLFLLLSSFFIDVMAAPSENNPEDNKKVLPCSRAFSIYDIDRNGSLGRDEYRQFVEQIEIRRNSTGRPMRRYSPPLLFEEIDSNKDEYLTEDEMISALNKRLRKHRRYRYKSNQP